MFECDVYMRLCTMYTRFTVLPANMLTTSLRVCFVLIGFISLFSLSLWLSLLLTFDSHSNTLHTPNFESVCSLLSPSIYHSNLHLLFAPTTPSQIILIPFLCLLLDWCTGCTTIPWRSASRAASTPSDRDDWRRERPCASLTAQRNSWNSHRDHRPDLRRRTLWWALHLQPWSRSRWCIYTI